ncbi:unnamed protein product [Aspergillus oryzae var. brunneus]|uniref:Unnamed protein product n=1 Tax=Aspergillus oryzae var. brunneus TaxID=332754 RepID=A0ABQ6KF72_ASPOZ|nr:unnamed protein product [Aspergillus oryzae]GMG42054.1 unnamed protein product [Aspergillus oryzae var. brunneus]
MSSAAVPPAIRINKPPSIALPSALSGDTSPSTLSRDSSPHSSACSSPDGSRSTSRRRPSPKPIPVEMQQTPDFCCPCGGFLGWKQIRLGGKSLSRSYSDLRALGNLHARGWAWETSPPPVKNPPPTKTLQVEQPKPAAGLSRLETLPSEVLGKCDSILPWP